MYINRIEPVKFSGSIPAKKDLADAAKIIYDSLNTGEKLIIGAGITKEKIAKEGLLKTGFDAIKDITTEMGNTEKFVENGMFLGVLKKKVHGLIDKTLGV